MRKVTERWVPLEGTRNFRDVGGYAAAAGRHVRRGVLYRAGDLATLTPKDVRTLQGLGIRSVVDLRRDDERAGTSQPLAERELAHHRVSVQPSPPLTEKSAQERARFMTAVVAGTMPDTGRPLPPAARARLLAWATARAEEEEARRYDELVDDRRGALRAVLGILARPGALPAVVHCTAGKDRTGVVIGLLLSAAGVSDDDVVADFALSNRFWTGPELRRLRELHGATAALSDHALASLVGVEPALMAVVLDRTRAAYGSVEAYFGGAADVEALREALLT